MSIAGINIEKIGEILKILYHNYLKSVNGIIKRLPTGGLLCKAGLAPCQTIHKRLAVEQVILHNT